jgi:hypothetical protein|tara:strand:- start:1569 stop:1901 length:333 start_codon:yes stop_codon:yes gene_type:complete
MKKRTSIMVAIIATAISLQSANANLPKYGKWCGNSDLKLKAKAIDKIDKSCKRNFKCRLKATSGFDRLKCDTDLIKYLEGRGKKYIKTKESNNGRDKILAHLKNKAKIWK